jgi:hypothetical protein
MVVGPVEMQAVQTPENINKLPFTAEIKRGYLIPHAYVREKRRVTPHLVCTTVIQTQFTLGPLLSSW